MANLEKKFIEFFLNDVSMGIAFTNIEVSGNIRIAVSASRVNVRINIEKNLKYSPKTSAGTMTLYLACQEGRGRCSKCIIKSRID